MHAPAIVELRKVLEHVRPGQRIHGATILKAGVRDALAREILMDPNALACLIREQCSLREVACSGAIDEPPGVRILRRRFYPQERIRVVVDLNNLCWTISHGVVSNLLQDLRSFGVREILGIGDASLAEQVGKSGVVELEQLCNTVRIVSPGTPADQVILDQAVHGGTMVLSNDTFRDWRSRFPALRRSLWRIRFSVASAPERQRGYTLGDTALELDCPPCNSTATGDR